MAAAVSSTLASTLHANSVDEVVPKVLQSQIPPDTGNCAGEQKCPGGKAFPVDGKKWQAKLLPGRTAVALQPPQQGHMRVTGWWRGRQRLSARFVWPSDPILT